MILSRVIIAGLVLVFIGSANAALTGPYVYEGNEYYVVTNCQDWHEAESQAVGLGGHLVSISDSDENDFVASIIPWGGGWWTGLSDQITEGDWVWSDGSATTYLSWNQPYEPNGGINENCVEMGNTGVWNDLPCDRCIGAILEVSDYDGDGFGPAEDCNDMDPAINPDAVELPGNFVDENCDGDIGECSPCIDWKNHGHYVRCIAFAVEELVNAGLITEDEGDVIVRSGAQSDVGKRDFVPEQCTE